ncbi:23S rRNA accumulation protein YceD [Alteromonadaceae bacterium M269]|nr:23S rRNA accumulation protein YceD [Alteromonadaceae bacterium M269]
MQKVKLPKQLDPIKNAQKGAKYEGIMLSRDMGRLVEAVTDVADDIDIKAMFDIDAQGLAFFQGSLSTSVKLVCQRCNEIYEQAISTDFCFSPYSSSQNIDDLPDVYEPVEVNDHGEINLVELFEDELMLSLPIVAMHPEEDCKVSANEMTFGKIEPAVEQPNPFAVLKELKQNQE